MKKNNFLLNFVLLLASLFYSGSIHADNPKVKGYYINKNGETQNVLIEVYTSVFSDKIIAAYHQSGFKCIDKKGKKIKVGVEDADQFGFIYQGEKYVFQYVPKKQGLDALGPVSEGTFCRLIVDGPCQLLVIGIQRSGPGSGIDDEFVLWKNKEDVYLTRTGMRKLAISLNTLSLEELFSDCPDLVSKIKNKQFKKDDDYYKNLVTFYNGSCQSNAKEQEKEEQEE